MVHVGCLAASRTASHTARLPRLVLCASFVCSAQQSWPAMAAVGRSCTKGGASKRDWELERKERSSFHSLLESSTAAGKISERVRGAARVDRAIRSILSLGARLSPLPGLSCDTRPPWCATWTHGHRQMHLCVTRCLVCSALKHRDWRRGIRRLRR